jgi:hypothetical protein
MPELNDRCTPLLQGINMLSTKAVEDGHLAFATFEARYEEFVSAVTNETEFRYGKSYRHLKEVRKHAGKLGETLKRAGRPSRFLEAALVAYDYSDALAVRAAHISEVDRRVRICAAAMRVVREAVQYEFMDGIFSGMPKPKDYYAVPETAAY